jgi:hypothetical protein
MLLLAAGLYLWDNMYIYIYIYLYIYVCVWLA